LEAQHLMSNLSTGFRKSAAHVMIVGATTVVMGCGGETPVAKPEAAAPAPAAPLKKLTAAEQRAMLKKQLTENEPSAQERRREKLKTKAPE
jgi:hypothetical protein